MSLLAGKDSVKTFRHNIYKRLAEAFVNLSWICNNDNENFNKKEFQIYENLLNSLKAEHFEIPQYVINYYNIARDSIENK